MRILMLGPLPPPSGGIASWTVQYRDYCEANNIPLSLVNIAMTGDRASKEAVKRNFRDEILRTYKIIVDLKNKLVKFKPDIVHINTSCSRFGLLRDLLCLMMAKRNTPAILHCRCNIEDQLKGNIAKLLFRYMVKKADAVVVLNQFSKRYVDDIKKNKAVFIPNFINENFILENHVINQSIREVLTVGHIEKDKGLYEIIDAAGLNPQLKFTLVGAVRENISALNIPANIEIAGRVDQKEVPMYLKRADVFLLPTKTEGFSNAILEAMAQGLPIISSDAGANSEMIGSRGGIVLEQCTGAGISRAFIKLSDADVRKEISKWNIDKVKKNYTADRVMKKYFAIYERIVRNHYKCRRES